MQSDVNTVCFGDESGHLIYSGSDDNLCKVNSVLLLTRSINPCNKYLFNPCNKYLIIYLILVISIYSHNILLDNYFLLRTFYSFMVHILFSGYLHNDHNHRCARKY